MVVLRANGCEHYKKNGGCSMCSHFNGVDRNYNVSTEIIKNNGIQLLMVVLSN